MGHLSESYSCYLYREKFISPVSLKNVLWKNTVRFLHGSVDRTELHDLQVLLWLWRTVRLTHVSPVWSRTSGCEPCGASIFSHCVFVLARQIKVRTNSLVTKCIICFFCVDKEREEERVRINKGLVISSIWVAVWFQRSLSPNLCHCQITLH